MAEYLTTSVPEGKFDFEAQDMGVKISHFPEVIGLKAQVGETSDHRSGSFLVVQKDSGFIFNRNINCRVPPYKHRWHLSP
jgi:hypothetical protein